MSRVCELRRALSIQPFCLLALNTKDALVDSTSVAPAATHAHHIRVTEAAKVVPVPQQSVRGDSAALSVPDGARRVLLGWARKKSASRTKKVTHKLRSPFPGLLSLFNAYHSYIAASAMAHDPHFSLGGSLWDLPPAADPALANPQQTCEVPTAWLEQLSAEHEDADWHTAMAPVCRKSRTRVLNTAPEARLTLSASCKQPYECLHRQLAFARQDLCVRHSQGLGLERSLTLLLNLSRYSQDEHVRLLAVADYMRGSAGQGVHALTLTSPPPSPKPAQQFHPPQPAQQDQQLGWREEIYMVQQFQPRPPVWLGRPCPSRPRQSGRDSGGGSDCDDGSNPDTMEKQAVALSRAIRCLIKQLPFLTSLTVQPFTVQLPPAALLPKLGRVSVLIGDGFRGVDGEEFKHFVNDYWLGSLDTVEINFKRHDLTSQVWGALGEPSYDASPECLPTELITNAALDEDLASVLLDARKVSYLEVQSLDSLEANDNTDEVWGVQDLHICEASVAKAASAESLAALPRTEGRMRIHTSHLIFPVIDDLGFDDLVNERLATWQFATPITLHLQPDEHMGSDDNPAAMTAILSALAEHGHIGTGPEASQNVSLHLDGFTLTSDMVQAVNAHGTHIRPRSLSVTLCDDLSSADLSHIMQFDTPLAEVRVKGSIKLRRRLHPAAVLDARLVLRTLRVSDLLWLPKGTANAECGPDRLVVECQQALVIDITPGQADAGLADRLCAVMKHYAFRLSRWGAMVTFICPPRVSTKDQLVLLEAQLGVFLAMEWDDTTQGFRVQLEEYNPVAQKIVNEVLSAT